MLLFWTDWVKIVSLPLFVLCLCFSAPLLIGLFGCLGEYRWRSDIYRRRRLLRAIRRYQRRIASVTLVALACVVAFSVAATHEANVEQAQQTQVKLEVE